MSGDAARRLRELYDRASSLPSDEVMPFLEAACGGDLELLEDVRSLLEHGSKADASFLEPATTPLGPSGAPAPRREAIGPYRILAPLGRGGHGSVYRAEHETSRAIVAIKTLNAPSLALLDGIRREIHTLAQLRHEGIVRILDHGVHDGVPWYAMDLVEGKTLGKHVAQLPPGAGLPSRLALVHRLCDPLAYLHGEGIVHRDLKPGNVLVRADGTPVLVDLGLASPFAGRVAREVINLEGLVVGTVLYIAPEQARGELVDARADLYSLGCILYELCTGQLPFVGEGPVSVLKKHLEQVPLPPSELDPTIPAGLSELVLHLLAKDPRERVGYATDVAAALERLGVPPAAAKARRHRSYLYRSRLAGRDRELRRMTDRVRRVSTRGGIVLIGGEGGVGKTRFALELGGLGLKAGLQVALGECRAPLGASPLERASAPPLQALRPLLRHLADRCRELGTGKILCGDWGPLLAQYEPLLDGVPGIDAATHIAPLPPSEARQRLHAALLHVLRALAARAPLLVVLDDLHWIDELSVGFLEQLARADLAASRLLVVGTYRTGDEPEALARIRELPGVEALELGRLEEPDVAAMVSDMLALSEPASDLAAFLARESEGNPMFVAEYLRAAVWEEILTRGPDGRYQIASERGRGRFESLPLPASLRELIVRRLTGLAEDARKMADAAAVAGSGVPQALVVLASGMPEHDALPGIEELIARQVLDDAVEGGLRFTHDKIREVVYEGISPFRRTRIHRACAEALAKDPRSNGADLALHWERAGEAELARAAYLAGARRTLERNAHAEAERLYRSFLRLSPPDERETLAVRIELAHRVVGLSGRRAEAIAELESCLALAARRGDGESEATAARALGYLYHVTGRGEEAMPLYERCVALARGRGDAANERLALERMAHLLQERGQPDRARLLYGESLALHRAAGDGRAEARALANLATLHHLTRDMQGARALYAQALEIFRRLGDPWLEAVPLANLAALELELGATPEAEALYRRSLELARGAGHRTAEMLALGNLGLCRQLRAATAEARELFEAALAIAREVDDPRCEASNRVALASLLLPGDPAACARDCRAILADPRFLEDRQLQGSTRCLLATALLRAGRDLDEAEALVREATELLREVGDRLEVAKALCLEGELRIARGGDARELLAAADAVVDELGVGPESDLARARESLRRAVASRGPAAP